MFQPMRRQRPGKAALLCTSLDCNQARISIRGADGEVMKVKKPSTFRTTLQDTSTEKKPRLLFADFYLKMLVAWMSVAGILFKPLSWKKYSD